METEGLREDRGRKTGSRKTKKKRGKKGDGRKKQGKDKKWEGNSVGRWGFVPSLSVALHHVRSHL